MLVIRCLSARVAAKKQTATAHSAAQVCLALGALVVFAVRLSFLHSAEFKEAADDVYPSEAFKESRPQDAEACIEIASGLVRSLYHSGPMVEKKSSKYGCNIVAFAWMQRASKGFLEA